MYSNFQHNLKLIALSFYWCYLQVHAMIESAAQVLTAYLFLEGRQLLLQLFTLNRQLFVLL